MCACVCVCASLSVLVCLWLCRRYHSKHPTRTPHSYLRVRLCLCLFPNTHYAHTHTGALGWGSVAEYEKNLRAEGHPVGCVVPGAQPQMAARGGKLTMKPHGPVQEHNSNIIKWMFGDLFDDHPQKSLRPTALHLGGKLQVAAKKVPAPVVRRHDGSVVHKTAAERSYDDEEVHEERELRAMRSERPARKERTDRKEHHQESESRWESERGLERKEKALSEREAHDKRVEKRVAAERKELQKLRAEEAHSADVASRDVDRNAEGAADDEDDDAEMRDPIQADAQAEKPLAPTKQLAKAMSDAGSLWGDKAVPLPSAAAAPQPVVAARDDRRHERRENRRSQDDDDERSVEQVKSMAEEAKALGYKLVPQGLEAKAQMMGYDLVPRVAVPAPSDAAAAGGAHLDSAMRAQEGEMSSPAKLELLAERDVVHQLSMMSKTKDAKRLAQQAKLENRLKLEFKAQHDVKMAQLREQSRAKREAEHRNADSTIKRYGTMLSFPDESRHAEMKLLEEHMTGESLQNKQVALERKNAGKLARTQLSHYNLLTFDEDEV